MSKAATATKSNSSSMQRHAARTQAASQLAASATAFANTLPAPATAANHSSTLSRTSIHPASPSSALPSLPSTLLSPQEQKDFQVRFRAAQKSPHLVGLQIQALDGLIRFLKQKRETARRIISESQEEIRDMEREQAMIHVKLDPLASRIAANQSRLEELLATREKASAQMGEIITSTGAHVAKTQHAIDAFKSRQLKQEMEFERGRYKKTTTPTSTNGVTSPSNAATAARR